MRLDFNVLWVEDNQANVKSQQDRIAFLIRKEGFRLCVKFAASVDEATTYISDEIYGDHIDLILMDYDLGTGKWGDEGLLEVRRIMPFKDIVFYSGMATSTLRAMVAEKQLEGVYASDRKDLPSIVQGVFENLVHKVLDIDHSRGIVMGATSEIDQLISSSLDKLFEGCSDDKKQKCISYISKRLSEKEALFNKAIGALKGITSYKELSEHHGMYTSDDKLRLLRKTLLLVNEDGRHEEKLITYQTQLTPKRNDLAHVTVQKDGFLRKLFNRDGVELTSIDMKELRISLLDYQEFFDQLFFELK